MGIKIKGLKIRNFRCIGELDLDFTDPDGAPLDLVVLAGPNGCGKTSVLEAIKILLDWKDEDYNPEWFSLARQADVRQGAEQYQLEFEMDYANDADRIGISGPHYYPNIPFPPHNHPHNQMHGKGNWSDRNKRIAETPSEYFSSRRRQKLVPSLPISDEKRDKNVTTEESDRLFALQKKCKNLWLYSAMHKLDTSSNPKVRAIIDPLEKVWEIFYPGEKAEFFVRSVVLDDPESDYNLFLRKEDCTEVPVNDLSSGEIQVLTMAGWFTMNDFKGGIVLIDEPELHLHEEWHRAIMRALRVLLPDTQIIVATHSAEILDSVMSYERFWLFHEGDPRLSPGDKPVIHDSPK